MGSWIHLWYLFTTVINAVGLNYLSFSPVSGDFSHFNWQNKGIISAINKFLLMRMVLYWSHKFAFKCNACVLKIFELIRFTLFEISTAVIWAGMRLYFNCFNVFTSFSLENNLYFVEKFSFYLTFFEGEEVSGNLFKKTI